MKISYMSSPTHSLFRVLSIQRIRGFPHFTGLNSQRKDFFGRFSVHIPGGHAISHFYQFFLAFPAERWHVLHSLAIALPLIRHDTFAQYCDNFGVDDQRDDQWGCVEQKQVCGKVVRVLAFGQSKIALRPTEAVDLEFGQAEPRHAVADGKDPQSSDDPVGPFGGAKTFRY